jgi:Skp family chaperone for outer membrane proteins
MTNAGVMRILGATYGSRRLAGMKLLPLVVLVALAGCADRVGYVNLQAALAETKEWQAASADLGRDLEKKRGEVNEATTAAKKAEEAKEAPDAVKAKQDAAAALAKRLEGELNERRQQAEGRVVARLLRLLPGIAADRRMAAIAAAPVFVRADLDVTQELIKRANAGEGEAPKDKGP